MPLKNKNKYKTAPMQSIPTSIPLWVKGAIEAYTSIRSQNVPCLASLLHIWESPTGSEVERKAFLEFYYQGLPCDVAIARIKSKAKIMYAYDELERMAATRQASRGSWKSLSLPPLARSRERAAS